MASYRVCLCETACALAVLHKIIENPLLIFQLNTHEDVYDFSRLAQRLVCVGLTGLSGRCAMGLWGFTPLRE